VKYVFVNGRVAVMIRYWEQRAAAVEGGARVDIREVTQVEGEIHRPGAAGFTVGPVTDGGIWRADLFVVLNDGGTPCFHYHPEFRDGDVGDRFDEPELAADPRRWIEDALADLPGILEQAGFGRLISSVDMDEHRRGMPAMMAAIDACLARVPVTISQWMAR
jgi:hypothetical protein